MSCTKPTNDGVAFAAFLGVVCLTVAAATAPCLATVKEPWPNSGGCSTYIGVERATQDSILQSIASYPADVELLVVNSFPELHYMEEKRPPLPYFALDLYRARSLIESFRPERDSRISGDEDALYFRLSDRYRKDRSSPRYKERIPDPRRFVYVGSPNVMDGLCRILFVTRSKEAIDAQYRPMRLEKVMADGSRKPVEHTFLEFLSELGYAASDISQFTNVVFKMCDGGVFGLAPAVVREVLEHDRPECLSERQETVPRYGKLVSFSKREVSEIAFWVFAKRNRRSVYSRLAERHPELFLPMSGFADFETEVGKGLVNWAPPEEKPPQPRRVPPPPPTPPPQEVRRLLPYGGDAAISADLRRYRLKTGVFVCSGAKGSNEVPFLVYGPKRGAKGDGPLPMLVYFGGMGEMGGDLARQFHQRTVVEQVTSDEFQSRRPCYLFAPVFPSGLCDVAPLPGSPSRSNYLTMEALRLVLARLGDAVDTNRLYTTGLSSGGCMAFDMLTSYPGVFAASVPVGGFERHGMITNRVVAWKIENARKERDDDYYWSLSAVARRKGGELRYSAYPSLGHNAWDRAWSDPRVWDWLFAQALDGRAVPGLPPPAQDLSWAKCSSSRQNGDDGHPPRCGADGLSGTWFMLEDAVRGDWWATEFESPLAGRFEVETGRPDGGGIVRAGRVETSEDGRRWTVAATLSKKSGAAAFSVRRPVRAVRVVVTDASPGPFVIRNLTVR